ncbi:hypothetical protein BB561_004758 [Smittium simulii]|uniref:ADF-H domain-containing protein n=1 Tax=Smittium simulii TaxID=133385 RepID=A0A2T9YED8_9FUNG|nr:hypothetical protein BB561_004758 [Smittium simulii]
MLLLESTKISPKELLVVPDSELQNCSLEDIADELPDASPRFITMTFKWTTGEGRTIYPLLFIYYCPAASQNSELMLYASATQHYQSTLNLDKMHMLEDAEELTTEWISKKLVQFGN